MKIKTLSRSTSVYAPQGTNASAQPRNLDPTLHPFERAREYTRALNATKLDRLFAKPFLAQLGNGHVDGVYSFAKDPTSLSRVASGAGDGEIKIWDLGRQSEARTVKAHDGIVKGLSYVKLDNGIGNEGRSKGLLSCAADKVVKLWDIDGADGNHEPEQTWFGSSAFHSISSHRFSPSFATASNTLDIWDLTRQRPTTSLTFSANTAETLTAVRFSPSETSMLLTAGSDRTLTLYDLRTNSALQRLTTTMRSNHVEWNPMEPFNFATANEDHNVYLFDARYLSRALNVLKDHVAAVMSLDFSPTGEEIVTGSYDRTIRLFKTREGHSRDIYHTSRMQRVFSVAYTMDEKYVLSGSDDGNVRLWRAKASERSGVKSAKQRAQLEYADSLKKRWGHAPEIRRISKSRHVPQQVKKAAEIKREEVKAIKRKDERRRKAGEEKGERKGERMSMVVGRET